MTVIAREEIMKRYTNGMTKSPLDLTDEYLVQTFLLYSDLQSPSTMDEMYLSILESEIDRRREIPFNRDVIDEILPLYPLLKRS
jgi:hypothetical protein